MFVISIIPVILCSQTSTAPSAGDGTSGNPYQIATLENLYWISQNSGQWSKCFVQTADIDASATSGWDGGAGWPVINTFGGTYDGNGYTIDGLAINCPSCTFVGLFGTVSSGGTIKRLGVTNVSVAGYYYVGGLVGQNSGTIENCFASGEVAGSYAWIGGLMGGNDVSGLISACYSRANAAGGECVGSLTGENYNGATIQNCYATGNVTGSDAVGAFSGTNYQATVTNSYSTGTSSGNGFIGGVGGTWTCTNSFWDTVSSGKTSGGGGTGKSTAQMKTQSTFTDAGWDFTTIWEMVGTNYPRLQAIPDPALPVELVRFTATLNGPAVVLHWSTATEVNSYGFDIERRTVSSPVSTNVRSTNWAKTGFVQASGTSNSPHNYSYTDQNLAAGTYAYRLKQIDRSGVFKCLQETQVTVEAPNMFSLAQNYPDPFNPTTMIQFTVPTDGKATLRIFNMLGQEVAMLFNGDAVAGIYHQVQFNASNLASGIYISRLEFDGKVQMKKMVFLK